MDRWLLSRLGRTIERATAAMEEYELAAARGAIERFFWSDFCDIYLELVKYRLRPHTDETATSAQPTSGASTRSQLTGRSQATGTTPAPTVSNTLRATSVSLCLCGERTSRDSAIDTLRTALLAVLTLLAPYLPHVTEEIYLRGFATGDGASIHREHWPDASDFPPDAEAMEAGEAMLAVVEAVRRWKGERHLSVGAPLSGLIISCDAARASAIQSMEMDLRSISRAARIMIESGEGFAVSIEDE